MILNRTGAEFEYEGVTYTIGGAIVGTAESEYAGLYGRINAIHDGEDKETKTKRLTSIVSLTLRSCRMRSRRWRIPSLICITSQRPLLISYWAWLSWRPK